MDDNTFKLALAIVAMVQVIALAWLTVQQVRVTGKVDTATAKVAEVHTLVNGLSHEKDAAIDSASRAQGELAGRDFEAAKHVQSTEGTPP